MPAEHEFLKGAEEHAWLLDDFWRAHVEAIGREARRQAQLPAAQPAPTSLLLTLTSIEAARAAMTRGERRADERRSDERRRGDRRRGAGEYDVQRYGERRAGMDRRASNTPQIFVP